MYVACPACKSIYAIQPAHLRAAGGDLRCGACAARFNATAAVFDDPQQALAYAEQQQQDVTREIDELVDRALGQVQEEDAGAEPEPDYPATALVDSASSPADQADIADHLDSVSASAEQPQPESVEASNSVPPAPAADLEPTADIYSIQADRDCYAQPTAAEFGVLEIAPEARRAPQAVPYLLDEPFAEGGGISWGAIAVSLLLIALLGVQYVWQQRYRLAELPDRRPVMEQFCALLHCDLPLRHEPAMVEMIEREVRDHPAVTGALLINAAFENRAAFRQAYPVFQLSFTDVTGAPVSIRRFAPEEYLQNNRAIAQGMAPGEQSRVTLEVVDPGTRAVSFQFEFF